ncbi:unnamed protein product, partial [Pneumocystis jirovecii]
MGLFPEIQRAWITVDNRLYLWNYLNGEDFQSYEDLDRTIICIKLVKPRPGVFIDSIEFLLVISTLNDIFLLGVEYLTSKSSENAKELVFYSTKMSISVSGIDVLCIEETILQLVTDNSRNLLYALTSKSSIRAYHLANQQSLNHVISYSYRSIVAHAQMVNASSSLLDPRTTTIISLAPVPLSESSQIYLIAITSTGCRLYLRASRSSWSINGPPSTMTCTHVRFPPVDSDNKQEDYKVQPSNISYKVLNNNTLLNSLSSFILTSIRIGHVFSPGYFLAFKSSASVSEGDKLFASAADTGRILHGTLNNHRLSLVETAGWIPLEGYVQAVSLLTPPTYCPNELKTQYNVFSPQIAVLTNTGVHIIQRRNNFQILYSAIKYGASTLNGVEGEIQSFFEMVGQAEGCATCLGLICGKIDTISQPDEYYNTKYFSNRNNILADSDIIEIARKYYIEFGGKPFTKQTQYKFGQEVLDLDNVQLSARHDGLVIYIARSIGELWKKPFIKHTINKKLSIKTYSSNFPTTTLLRIRSEFVTLLEFLDNNKSYIKGLVAPDQLSGSMSRSEEISFQAEHRALHALILLIRRIIEGLSFVCVLIDDTPSKLHDIISSLSKQSQDNCLKLTFEDLFSKESGKELAKDLVTAIVNKQLAGGGSVDAVSESLRKRCGGFCSADDVIMYKAIEQLRRAKEKFEFSDEKKRSLQECLRLFMKIASNLTLENLNETVAEFRDLGFHTDNDNSNITLLRDDTYKTAYLSRDKLFHYSLYDWYVERGMLERILNVKRRSINDLDLADLLWQYHSKHGSFYEAARVLYELAQSNFPITLGQRMEYLSRGKGLCNCDVSLEIRPMMNKLAHDLQEELDVITIQDDIIQSIRNDERLSVEKKHEMIRNLDGKLIPLTELFNKYADLLGYGEICLAIFHVSDYRGKADIIQCWEKIITKENNLAFNKDIKAYEAISELIRRLGRKFGSSENVFPLEDLVPMLEVYSFERQDDGVPQGWVIESFLSAGVSHGLIFSILDEMIDRRESPWQTKSALIFLIKEAVHLITLWVKANTKAAMSEQMKEWLELPNLFLKEGTQFINRCTKPDKE